MNRYGLTREEYDFFKSLNTPEKIQDYLDKLDYNFCDYPGKPYECNSPKLVIQKQKAHCFEGALVAAACLRINKEKPLVVELNGPKYDDHIIAVFKRKGFWGAIAKSQYNTLTWRNPVHRSIRELALTYLPFYFVDGSITLRDYSIPINLSRFDYMNWISTSQSLEELGDKLYYYPKHQLFNSGVKLRKVPLILENLTRKYKKPKPLF